MIELKIDTFRNIFEMQHDFHNNEDIAEQLIKAIDIIVADYYVKLSNVTNKYPIDKKIQIAKENRRGILQIMMDSEYTCPEYLNTEEDHIRPLIIEE